LLYYAGIGLGLALFLQQLWQGGQAVYGQAIYLDEIAYLFAALGIMAVAYGLQMMAWVTIMRGLGTQVDRRAMFQGYIISFLPRYIPGTVWGYLSRGEWLKSKYGISYATSTLGSMLEVGLIILTSGMIAAIYYIWPILSWPTRSLFFFGILLLPWSIWYGLHLALPFLVSRMKKLAGFSGNIDFYLWIKAFGIYLVMWGCYGLSLIWLMTAFDIQHNATVFQATFIFSLSWLIGFAVIVVPSGLGVRELTLHNLLVSQLALFPEAASIVAVVSRLLFFLVEVMWLFIGITLLQIERLANKYSEIA